MFDILGLRFVGMQFMNIVAGMGNSWNFWPFGPGFTGSWLIAITKFIFIGFVLAILIWFLRFFLGPGGVMRDEEYNGKNNNEQSNALKILAERFARGEIDEEEYKNKKRVLGYNDNE